MADELLVRVDSDRVARHDGVLAVRPEEAGLGGAAALVGQDLGEDAHRVGDRPGGREVGHVDVGREEVDGELGGGLAAAPLEGADEGAEAACVVVSRGRIFLKKGYSSDG